VRSRSAGSPFLVMHTWCSPVRVKYGSRAPDRLANGICREHFQNIRNFARENSRQLMQQYFVIVDWQGFKLPSAKRRQRDSLKSFERSVEVWKDWIRLKKELATLGEKLPQANLLPAKRKKQSPDPTKRVASKEVFGRRALASGNMWESLSCLLTLWKSFDKINPEMGIDRVARQMHQEKV